MRDLLIANAWLVPALPLLGGLIAALGARSLRQNAHWPVAAGIGLAFLVSLGLLAYSGQTGTTTVMNWMDVTDLVVPIQLRVDGLSAMMLAMVTFVATLVTIFAAGYMAGDPAYPRFFALVGLFVASMTGLVLSNNFLLTYAFWEGVGVCSYLLIGFWHAKPSAAAAAKKAFLVNRIGDVGFAIAIFWMWSIGNHDLSYDNILNPNVLLRISEFDKTSIALLLFWAATAKSAQIPLYVWLPDAMEGPTPVSALIHAATMVTAGVYLVARSSVLIFSSPFVATIIAIVGCATALLAALIALTRTDLKQVLAYSTVSQLGYMFMGLGAGIGSVARLAVVAAMFHLFTHAFFKALLFLGSGSVMHSMGGVLDMRRFRGLRHRLPLTHVTFLIGSLALSGLFPLAGYWSKDEIILALKEASEVADEAGSLGMIYTTIYWIALVTAGLTAFYTGRAYFMTFWGPEKLPGPDDPTAEPSDTEADTAAHGHGHGHDDHSGHGHGDGHDSHFGHESPPIMTYPLFILAFCAAFAGLVFGPTHWFERQIAGTSLLAGLGHPEHEHAAGWMTPILSTVAALLGLGISYLMYAGPSPVPGRIASALGRAYRLSVAKFRVDEIYGVLVVGPTTALAKISAFFDEFVVDGLVSLAAWLPRQLGRSVLGPYQNGLVQFYAGATAFGLSLVLAFFFVFRSLVGMLG